MALMLRRMEQAVAKDLTPEHSHDPDAIRERLRDGHRINYISNWIYGGIDGAITTFAIVAGSLGAELSGRVVLILGMANILADGFSMAAANFAGTRADEDVARELRRVEERHIRVTPRGEMEEVRQIFAAKGFSGQVLEEIVEVITADKERWIETMMAEEYGITPVRKSAWLAAILTFTGFLICGVVPLLPFMLNMPYTAEVSVVMTACVFIAIGIAKSKWSPMKWWQSGLETLIIGLIAAGMAYGIGDFLNRFI